MSDQTLDPPAARAHARPTPTVRARLRTFRRTRPFWGCVVLTTAAYFIISPILTTVSATVRMGTAAVSGWVVGAIMLAAAGVSLVAPSQRHFAGIVAMIVSVASLVLTNLGGYVLGMVFGIVGSGMIFAWSPDLQVRRGARHRREPATAEPATAELAVEEPS
ncbi:MAG: hypothetical protein C0493_13730 [Kytococcus sp.]|nr:hypothetical protein [Kytococcus sp.]